MDHVDQEIRDECRRHSNESRRPDHWQRFERQLRNVEDGPQSVIPMAVSARDRGSDHKIFQSGNWPCEIDANKIADPPDPPPSPPQSETARPPHPGPFAPPDQPDSMNAQNRGLSQAQPPGPPPPISFGQPATYRTASGNWRVGVGGSQRATFIVAMNLAPLEKNLAQLSGVMMAAAIPGLLLIAAAGAFLATRALRPIAALTTAAERITARGLDQRMPATREAGEFQRLSDVFNDMLDRLEKSFQQATRFSADAAHELKTPLTILQGQIEESLRESADGSSQQKLCADLLEEVQRLKNIVRKLLLLSMADAGELRLNLEPVDLGSIVENAAEDAKILAPNLRIETAVAPPVKISADPDLIEQVLQNLVSNAIKYNRDGGFIRLELQQNPAGVRLAVTNSGAPIPAQDHGRLFERFYRGDPSRAKTVEGVGLGLSLAREIARAHGGELALERSDESGTVFVLTVPAA
jgi:heavy metal sensor kinase